jgi:hypothetical protein
MNHFYFWTSKYGSANNTFAAGTPDSIDYEGNIYEHFDPKFWIYHLGLGRRRNYLDKQSIGIELTNEGYMTKNESTGQFKWYSGDVALPYNRPQDEPVHVKNAWRGYNWFAPYSEKQIESTLWLVKYLQQEFGIKNNFVEDCEYHKELLDGSYEGIYNHVNVRSKGKWDLSPAFPFERFKKLLSK